MENVILIVHLILAFALIGIVLMQRSEGGGLGMGGGGGAVSGRAAATALGKLTWVIGAAFICTSLTLTILAANDSAGTSVLDRLGTGGAASESDAPADAPAGTDLLPPSLDENTPLIPRAD